MAAPSTFGGGLLLYAACCAAAAFFGWPLIKAALPDSFPLDHPYTNPEPYDGRGGGHRGGYSPYFPGPRGLRAPGMTLDPGEVSPNVEDRRHERAPPQQWDEARAGGGARCWDRQERRDVPMALCDRQDGRRPW